MNYSIHIKLRFCLIILLSILLKIELNAQHFVLIENDTNYHAKPIAKSWYNMQATSTGFLLNGWRRNKAFFVDNSFDTISNSYINSILQKNKTTGHIVATNNGNCFRFFNGKLLYYDAKTNKEKVVLKFPIKHKGVKYNLYQGRSMSNEGFNAYYDSISNGIIFNIEPKWSADLNWNWHIQKDVISKAHLLIWVDTKGKIIDGIGTYDEPYNYGNANGAGVSRFSVNTKQRLVVVTQKASTHIQTYNLDNKQYTKYALNMVHVKGNFNNYNNINFGDTIESTQKILIESPSFDDVVFDEYKNCYYVLRTDAGFDSTWEITKQKSVFNIKPSLTPKAKKAKVCSSGSPQMFKQFKVYANKPTYLQVYDANFKFVNEFKIDLSNNIRFVKVYPNYVLVNNPVLAKSMYRVYLK